jgi:hypothetical protein
MADTPTREEYERSRAVAHMRAAAGKPSGNGPVATQESPQAQAIREHAIAAADYIEQVGADADAIARLYQAECQKLAEEFRRATDVLLTRLLGPRK